MGPYHGSQQCGVGLCDIHGYFHGLIVDQRTPGFWSVTVKPGKIRNFQKWQNDNNNNNNNKLSQWLREG